MKRDTLLSAKVAKNLGNHAEWIHGQTNIFEVQLLNSSLPAGSSKVVQGKIPDDDDDDDDGGVLDDKEGDDKDILWLVGV